MGLVAFAGLLCSMMSIRLMSLMESSQIVIIGAIGHQLQIHALAMSIGTRKVFAIKIVIVFFSKLSSFIFLLQEMYPERIIQRSMLMVLNTTLVSNKVKVVATKHTRCAANKFKKTMRQLTADNKRP